MNIQDYDRYGIFLNMSICLEVKPSLPFSLVLSISIWSLPQAKTTIPQTKKMLRATLETKKIEQYASGEDNGSSNASGEENGPSNVHLQ